MSLVKLIIHVGFPKCGSTSIQRSLYENRDVLLSHGVSYIVDETYFRSHYSIAQLGRNSAMHQEMGQALRRQIGFARAAHCTQVVISNEELLFCADEDEVGKSFFSEIGRCASEEDVSVEFVLVVRDRKKFMRSYLLQQVSNGISIGKPGFVHFFDYFSRLLRTFCDSGFSTKVVSLDAASSGVGLLSVFYKEVLKLSVSFPERNDNSIANRTFVSEVVVGQVCSLFSALSDLHVNSEETDNRRIQVRELIDKQSKSPEVGAFLAALENFLLEQLDNLYMSAEQGMAPESRDFWDDVMARPVSGFSIH